MNFSRIPLIYKISVWGFVSFVACNSYWNNETGVQLFVNSLREKDKRRKGYLIIILGVLMVGLFLFSCGAYVNTMGEGKTNGTGR